MSTASCWAAVSREGWDGEDTCLWASPKLLHPPSTLERAWELLSFMGAQSQRAASSRSAPTAGRGGVLKMPCVTPWQVREQSSQQGEKASSENRPPTLTLRSLPSFSKAGWKEPWMGNRKTRCRAHVSQLMVGKPLHISEPKLAWVYSDRAGLKRLRCSPALSL